MASLHIPPEIRSPEDTVFDLRQVGADQGEWIHVAMVYDARVALYVNGELRDWKPKTEMARSAHVRDITLFNGQNVTVDEVRVFNKALLAEQVRALASE